jgi:hypothetical protein
LGATGESALHNFKRPENVPTVFTYLYKTMCLNVVVGLQIVGSCGLPEEMASIPLEFEEPVYGSNSLTFTDFMAPGRLKFL